MAIHLTRRRRRWFKAPKITVRERREQAWRNQCFGVLRFLGELKNSPQIGGEKWKAGMFAYYGRKAKDLLSQVPPGLESEAADFQRKLDRCKIPSHDR